MTRSPADRSHLSIGEVLSLLQDEFPDVTISKIRFLESQGLLDPERTPSGYRKFYDDDIERLRWILRQQKEHYLPLKVIKDRLDDRAAQAAAAAAEAEGSAAATPPAGRNGGGGRHGGRSSRNSGGRGGRTGAPGPSTASGPARPSVNGRGRSAVAVDERPDAAGAAGGASAGTDAARAAGPGAGGASGKGTSAAARVTTGEAYAREGASAPGSGGPGGPGPAARDAAADGTGRPAVADDSASEGRSPATAAPRPSGPSGPADAPGATPAARPPAGVDASRTIDIPHEGVRVDASQTGASGGRADGPAPGHPGRPSRLQPTPAAAPTGADTTGPVVPAGGATTGSSQAPVLAGYPDLARYAGLGHEASTSISLTIDELAEASGMTARDLHELEGFGLLESHVVGDAAYYDGDALVVARTAAGFLRHGIEARHLRTYKVAIDREAGLFEQIVLPLLKQRNPEAHRRANRIVAELIHLGEAMRGTLLRRELRDHIDP